MHCRERNLEVNDYSEAVIIFALLNHSPMPTLSLLPQRAWGKTDLCYIQMVNVKLLIIPNSVREERRKSFTNL